MLHAEVVAVQFQAPQALPDQFDGLLGDEYQGAGCAADYKSHQVADP